MNVTEYSLWIITCNAIRDECCNFGCVWKASVILTEPKVPNHACPTIATTWEMSTRFQKHNHTFDPESTSSIFSAWLLSISHEHNLRWCFRLNIHNPLVGKLLSWVNLWFPHLPNWILNEWIEFYMYRFNHTCLEVHSFESKQTCLAISNRTFHWYLYVHLNLTVYCRTE